MRRPLLLPLVPLYAAGLQVKQWLAPTPKHLQRPVISVGSLSAGGAGKTPVVVALVELLMRQGYAVDVLSRGYRRTSHEVARVDPRGDTESFGDEPLLIAQQTGAPVYVGAERYDAGLLAERDAVERQVHLLDDGFQHHRLGRDLDLVLFTQEDAKDCLLPAGNLREPLSQLQRANVVVLREEEAAALQPIVMQHSGEKSIWILRRRLDATHTMTQRPLAFCGIARPEGFWSMLRDAGFAPAGTAAFDDHHRYQQKDMELLIREARRVGADGFVTTEKDAVKLSGAMRAYLEAIGPLTMAKLTVAFADEGSVLARIRALDRPSAA